MPPSSRKKKRSASKDQARAAAPASSSKTTPSVSLDPPSQLASVPRKGRTWLLLIAGCGLLLALAAGLLWHRHRTPLALALAGHSNYVDPAECESCHADIAATYRKTGMGRSFYRPTAANVIEDYGHRHTFDHAASGMQYSLVQRGDTFFQRRSVRGADGGETDVVEQQVDYIVGSGNHARAYLHRTAQGRLVELPVSWYVEQSGYWAMTTGFDKPNQADMHGTVNTQCLSCHNGYPEMNGVETQAALADNRFPAKLLMGIDCQRCHGPGRAHVEAANAEKSDLKLIRATVVNPSKLSRERQMDVCMQCHLETSSPHAPAEIRAYERDIYSFQPGESLADYKTFFERVRGPRADEFQNAHAAYGLRKSACYLQTEMTCLTCHNPHDVPHGPEAIRGYIATCDKCHAAVKHTVALPTNENCITCHMPKRRTEGAVHLILTDHYIQRKRPAGNLLASITESAGPPVTSPVTFYYPQPTQPSPRQQLYLAIAQVDDGDGMHGAQHLQQLIEQQQPLAPEPYLELARAVDRRGDHAAAAHWYTVALQHRADLLPALRELPVTLLATGNTDAALSTLRHGVDRYPDDDVLLTELGNASLRAGQLDAAADALRRALQANPDRADAHNLQGVLEVRQGNQAAAEGSFREAMRLEPRTAEAASNLASILTGRKQFAQAAFLYHRVLQQQPQYAEAHHGLGLLLILQGQVPAALPELKAAAELQPQSAPVLTDYADALAATGDVAAAASAYYAVLAVAPGQVDAQLGLGMALLRQGRRVQAEPLLARVAQSGDPNMSPVALQALQGGVR